MNQHYFDVPFGFAGDVTSIPDPLQVGGTVSMTEGWNFNYQRDLATDPAALPIDRSTMNWLLLQITTALQALQTETVPEFILASQNGGVAISYGLGAEVLWSASGNAPFQKFVSIIAANANTPSASDVLGTTTGWQVVCDPIATSAQAGAGTNNASIMTPLLVAQQTALRALLAGSTSQVFNVGPAVTATQAPQAQQIQAQTLTAFATAGTAPAFTLTPVPAITALTANQRFRVSFNAAGTTGSNTLNINGLGAIALKQYNSNGTLEPASIPSAGFLSDVEYNGTSLVLLDPAPSPGTVLNTIVYMLSTGGVLQWSVNGAAFVNAPSATYTPLSALATTAEAEVGGAGAGGGGAASTTTAGTVSGGSGGGAGGRAWGIFPISSLSGQTVTAGAPGTAGTGANGGNGGTSSIGAVILATGGTGGTLGAAVLGTTNSFVGGVGGGVGSGGQINSVGGYGQGAFYAATPLSGKGGASFWGEGASPVSGTSGGRAAVSPCSGGSGGSLATGSGTNAAGGVGMGGIVIIRERA